MRIFLVITVLIAAVIFGDKKNIIYEANAEAWEKIIDTVSEYTPGGRYIQIGNYTIVVPEKILLAKEDGTFQPISSSYIRPGHLVKTQRKDVDKRGFILVDDFTVFEGGALAAELSEVPAGKRAAIEDTIKRYSAKDVIVEPEAKADGPVRGQSGTIKLQNGVYSN